ncbi:hypothetical protein HDU93_004330 [Gonapodya sp. JEL0774]|nr:hypothetical protein HDU93_004330 [Gonapodya sp. JEL0774]
MKALSTSPGRTLGAVLETTVVSGFTGSLVASLVHLAAEAVTVQHNQILLATHPNNPTVVEESNKGSIIKLIFMLAAVFATSWIRSRFARLRTFALIAGTTVVVNMEVARGNILQTDATRSFGPFLNFIIASLISLSSALILWPDSANGQVKLAVVASLDAMRASLDAQLECFLPNTVGSEQGEGTGGPGIVAKLAADFAAAKEAQDRLLSCVKQLATARDEARMEVSYGYYDPHDLGLVSKAVQRLSQDMGGIYSATLAKKDWLDPSSSDVALHQMTKSLVPTLQALGTECTATLAQMKRAFHNVKARAVTPSGGLYGRLVEEGAVSVSDEVFLDDERARLEVAIQEFDTSKFELEERLFREAGTGSHLLLMELSNTDAPNLNDKVLILHFFIFSFREFAQELNRVTSYVKTLYSTRQTVTKPWLPRALFKRKAGANEWDHDSSLKSLPDHEGIRPVKNFGSTRETQKPGLLRNLLDDTLYTSHTFFSSPHTSYAITVTVTVFLASVLALFDATNAFYLDKKAYNTAFAALLCLSPSVGSTMQATAQRTAGMIFGAIWGYLSWWSILPGNGYVIAVMLLPFAVVVVHLLLGPSNVVAIMAFITFTNVVNPLYMLDEAPIRNREVILERFLEVLAGAVLALVLMAVGSPTLAKVTLREELAKTLYDVSMLYQRLAQSFFSATLSPKKNAMIPLETEISGENFEACAADNVLLTPVTKTAAEPMPGSTSFISDPTPVDTYKLHLAAQLQVLRMNELFGLAEREPNLERPWNGRVIRAIVDRVQSCLDLMGSLRSVTGRRLDSKQMSFACDFKCREVEMISSIVMYLQILSGVVDSKRPAPTFVPRPWVAWLQWLRALQRHPESLNQIDRNSSYAADVTYLFAWGAATGRLITEMLEIEQLLEQVYGREDGGIYSRNLAGELELHEDLGGKDEKSFVGSQYAHIQKTVSTFRGN